MAHASTGSRSEQKSHDHGTHGTHQLLKAGSKALDAKERKRIQNRIAQRTYRRNQKERLRSLELAAGLGLGDGMPQPPPTPPISEIDQAWLLSPEENFESSLSFPSSDKSNASDVSSMEDKGDALRRDLIDESKSQSPSAKQGDAFDPFDNFLAEDQSAINRTALHRAVCARHEAITRLLLRQGADATKQDGNGQTCLHLAVQYGWESFVKLLLDSKVDPNMQDALGQTALFQAVQCENLPVTRVLLESSIDVNSRDTFGNVALHLAVDLGSEKMIELLLSHGADIDA